MATVAISAPSPAAPVTPTPKSRPWSLSIVSKALLFVVKPSSGSSTESSSDSATTTTAPDSDAETVLTTPEEEQKEGDKDEKPEDAPPTAKTTPAAAESEAKPAPSPVFLGADEIWGSGVATPSPKAQRRVSFSPSIEEEDDQRQQQEEEDKRVKRNALVAETQVRFPRASGPDIEDDEEEEENEEEEISMQRRVPPIVEPRKSSLDWVRQQASSKKPSAGKSSASKAASPRARTRTLSFGKGGIQVLDVRPNVSFPGFGKNNVTKANAIASRHAKVLERMINVDTNVAAATAGSAPPAQQKGVAGKLKRKPHTHTHGPHSAHHHVSSKQVRQLKKALMDVKLANGIIAELRAMDVDQGTFMVLGGEESQDSTATGCSTSGESSSSSGYKSPALTALRRVSLTDQERIATEEAARNVEAQEAAAREVTPSARGPLKAICLEYPETEAMERHINDHYTSSLEASTSHSSSADAPLMPFKIPSVPTVMGVGAINLLTSPEGAIASAGLDAIGIFSALGNASGAAIKASGTDAHLQPPMDRMAIFTFWWGFEITLPKPSMRYLATAHSVSGAFLNFISTMVISGGVPELLPIVKYLSMAFDLEFKAIQSADKGNGVVLAATWVMPLALVPRPWDYGLDSGAGTGPTPGAKGFTPLTVLPVTGTTTTATAKRQSFPPPPRDEFPQDLSPSVVHAHISSGGTPTQSTPRGSIALERLDEE